MYDKYHFRSLSRLFPKLCYCIILPSMFGHAGENHVRNRNYGMKKRSRGVINTLLEALLPMNDYKNNYPSIIINGFAGWGEDDPFHNLFNYWGPTPKRNLIHYLRNQGYEVYFPSLGPFASAWDRSCELYAYIFGGTVDFGKVHSEKFNHKRYGRTYPGVLKDLGKTEAHKKVNLYGHSFGGPTIKCFVDLMHNGWQEEVDGTPEDELSPLFKGGMDHLIHTMNTLSGVNNGTILDQFFNDKTMHMTEKVILKATSLLGHSRGVKVFDLGQQMFDLGLYPEDIHGKPEHQSETDFEKGFQKYASSKLDRSNWEMDIIWCKWMNDHQGVAPNIYYFAERADNSHYEPGSEFPKMNTMFPISHFTGNYIAKKQPVRETGYEYGPEWYPNDGFVPVVGQSAPLNQPAVEVGPETEFKPGIWHNMPITIGDHLFWMNWTGNKYVVRKTWDRFMQRARMLPDGEDNH